MSNISQTGPSDVLAANLRESAERDAQRARMRSKPANAFTLILDGLEVPVLSARVSRSIDTVADPWTAEISWIPGKDPDLDTRVAPYAYTKSQVYLGTTLSNTGRLYIVTNDFSTSGLTKQLEGWSYTADLVDSHIPAQARDHLTGAWSYEWTGLSVWNIMNALCRPLNINVKTDIGNVTLPGQSQRTAEPFPFVQAQLTESYAEIFTRLAFQRGMLVTNDEYGDLFLTAARTTGTPVASLGEGDIAAYLKTQATGGAKSPNWKAKFDGRKRFYAYTVYGQSGMADDISSESDDPVVPTSRIMNVIAGDVTLGNVRITAQWKRSKQLVQALSIPFPVVGWHTPHGDLWAPNTLVSVHAPSLHINTPFTFLIRQVEFVHESQGQTTQLSLVPPQCYTGDPIKEPWVLP